MSEVKKKYGVAAIIVLCIIGTIVVIYSKLQLSNHDRSSIPKKFGATYMTMNNPYFEVLNENIKEVVEANGDILITRDPLQDQEKQNEQIEEMINENVEAIFLNPVDWKGVRTSLELCKREGIPVFCIDTDVYDEKYIVSTIISDNYDAGVQCANDMMSKVESAKIIIVNHQNINSTNERVRGFLDTIAGKSEYEIVAQRITVAELEKAMKEMKNILKTGVEFNVVLGGNDPTALGCLAAMQQQGMESQVLLYGIDGSPDAKAMIKAGYMEATSAQSPIQIGETAATQAYKYLEGIKVEKNIVIPVTLISEKNLAEYDTAGWQ
ncbi:MAG: sugar ABC transporter substrate-binding protein [Lachnospiraceae bacterium]